MGFKYNSTFDDKPQESIIDTEAVPPDILLKLLLVEKRDNFIQALEYYYKNLAHGSEISTDDLRSRMISYYYDAKASLISGLLSSDKVPFVTKEPAQNKKPTALDNEKALTELEKKLFTTQDPAELLKIFDFVSNYLYRKGVLRFETRRSYDRTDIELSNSIAGFN